MEKMSKLIFILLQYERRVYQYDAESDLNIQSTTIHIARVGSNTAYDNSPWNSILNLIPQSGPRLRAINDFSFYAREDLNHTIYMKGLVLLIPQKSTSTILRQVVSELKECCSCVTSEVGRSTLPILPVGGGGQDNRIDPEGGGGV
jgi:hypothetical protein